MPRCYRFAEFTVSPSRRTLTRAGREVPLIPRYFDLLVLLIDRRREAVHRSEILDTVWRDVVVSDGALSQAVRTLRRALGDDPGRSQYIRTVSRYGYQFVFPDVVPSDDTAPMPIGEADSAAKTAPAVNEFEAAFAELASDAPENDRRVAAETLLGLNTEKTMARLRDAPGDAEARALLRDARWDLPQADPVPIFGQPHPLRTLWELFALRLRGVLRAAGKRYAAAVTGAMIAGL